MSLLSDLVTLDVVGYDVILEMHRLSEQRFIIIKDAFASLLQVNPNCKFVQEAYQRLQNVVL